MNLPSQPPYARICDSSDRDEWLSYRQRYLGASEAAILLGCHRWGSLFALYQQKIGAIEPSDLSDVEAVEWGQRLEPIIIQAYRERSGRCAEPDGTLCASTEVPWASCTLDGQTWLAGDPRDRWPLEVKNVSDFRSSDWVDGPPLYYVAQVHQQMLVTGTAQATIAALIGGQRLAWADVPRDERIVRKLIYAGNEFWERIQNHEPPPVDGSGATTSALADLYPQAEVKTIELSADFGELHERYRWLAEEIKELTEEQDGIKNRVKSQLAKARRGLLPDGRGWTWNNTKRGRQLRATGGKADHG